MEQRRDEVTNLLGRNFKQELRNLGNLDFRCTPGGIRFLHILSHACINEDILARKPTFSLQEKSIRLNIGSPSVLFSLRLVTATVRKSLALQIDGPLRGRERPKRIWMEVVKIDVKKCNLS